VKRAALHVAADFRVGFFPAHKIPSMLFFRLAAPLIVPRAPGYARFFFARVRYKGHAMTAGVDGLIE
ncbi:MAG: hypothetical protein RSC06_14940, partial [Clostridia bacterium]